MDAESTSRFFAQQVLSDRVFRFAGLERCVETMVLKRLAQGAVEGSSELGEACQAPTATMTGVLDKLQKARVVKSAEKAIEEFPGLAAVFVKGKCLPLVKRSQPKPTEDWKDRRKVGAELTEAGHRVIEIAFDTSAAGSETVSVGAAVAPLEGEEEAA